MNQTPFRILFVCMGNICRSPAGECVMRHLADSSGVIELVECESAGTIDLHRGKSPDVRMTEAGEKRGIAIRGAARQVRASDFSEFDLILAMDEENHVYLEGLQESCAGESRAELRMFCELVREPGHQDFEEVPDPYYGEQDGFEIVLDLLVDGCSALLEEIQSALR